MQHCLMRIVELFLLKSKPEITYLPASGAIALAALNDYLTINDRRSFEVRML